MAEEKPFYPLMGIVIASAAFVGEILQTQPHKVNSLIIRELPEIVTRAPSTIFDQIITFIPLYLTFIKNYVYSNSETRKPHRKTMLESIENKLPDIAVAMQKAYTEVLPTKTSKDLETHNSEPFLKWDCINTSLKGLDGYKTFEVRKTRRGSWSFLMLFESNSQTIFTLIKKKHFESIQKSRSKAIPKYIQQMLDCLQNKELTGDGAPYFLWENESEDRDMVNAMAMECFSFKCIKELSKAQHTFIVFDDFNDHLSFLSAIVVDNNFFQVGETINMMNMFTPELPLPLDTVPTSESEKPKVALSALALKIREERKLGN